MNSKEALEKLNNLIWREKHINSERNKIVNDCVNQIKQDLERLEALENENKELKEYSFLLELSKQHEESKNEKLKKAIETFLAYLTIEPNKAIAKHSIKQTLNKLLKEVIGNELD